MMIKQENNVIERTNSPIGKSQNEGQRILIVDDDAVICEIAESILAESGWTTGHACTPAEALLSMDSNRWPVVLCDVHLPGDSGELLQNLRTKYPTTQVVMITGDPTVGSMRHAMKTGAYDYLLKPIRREELLRVTELALDKYKLLIRKVELEEENERYRIQLEALVGQRTDQLRDSELRYRTLFNNAVDAIMLVNPKDGLIIELNGAAVKLAGRKSFDIVGTSIRNYVGEQLDRCLINDDSEFQVWRIPELVFRDHELNEHLTAATVNKIKLEGETVLQIVARDSGGDNRELAQRASLMELELMSEQRLANIGLLASGVAHNINTPLMGIYGLAQIIKIKHPELEDIDGVIAQVERINGIVRNLMWKSRQEQEQARQDIDFNILLQEELRFLEADMMFKHNVEKMFEFASDLPPIWGRYSDFSQSIVNIIRNALDSMHDSPRKQLHVITSKVDGNIAVTIKDTGSGIPAENLNQIFDPFFTTKPPVGKSNNGEPTGTGLGLSTVQKLLLPYSCRFDVQSKVGEGTAFTLFIPIEQNQPTEEELKAMH